MELNFKLQRNDELRLEKLCSKLIRKNNRHHIVEDMIYVKKAQREAIAEENIYKQSAAQTLPVRRSAIARRYDAGKLKKRIDRLVYRVKTRLCAYESTYLYVKYRILDLCDAIAARKKAFIAALCVVAALGGGLALYNYAFGYEIILNGHVIGVVPDMSVYNNAMNDVEQNFAEWYNNDSIYFEQSVTIRNVFIKDRGALLSEKECAEAIYGCDLPLFYNGGIITINGVETVRLASADEAQTAVDQFLNAQMYSTDENTELVRLVDSQVEQNIEVEEKIIALQNKKKKIAEDLIQTDENILKKLNKNDIKELFS